PSRGNPQAGGPGEGAVESLSRYADDTEGMAAQLEPGAYDGAIASESRHPRVVAQDGLRRCIVNAIGLRGEASSGVKAGADQIEVVAAGGQRFCVPDCPPWFTRMTTLVAAARPVIARVPSRR